MEFQFVHWGQSQAVSEKYMNHFESVRTLFEYDYRDREEYIHRAAWLDRHRDRRASADRVIQALLPYNERIGNSGSALDNIKRLADPETLVVVGGQQAGLFTGPLLVIHKAITIIRTARKLSSELGRPVIPVFWIAGEDHDYNEVNHIYHLNSQLEIEKIELPQDPAQAGKRLTISRRPIAGERWDAVLDRLDASLMQTEFKSGWMELLRSSCRDSASLSDAFARMMAHLFGSHGLVLVDSDDPLLRAAEAPMFRRLIERNAKLEQALLAAKETMLRLGFEPTADVREGSANLFWLQDGERLLLQRGDGGAAEQRDEPVFFDRNRVVQFGSQELADKALEMPQRLSNNVFTRPLMQDYLFPAAATVLGPGEIAYWGLAREAFRAMDMQMPVIVPRMEFTLVERTVHKQMGKLGLSLEDALFRLEEKRAEWLAAQDTLGLTAQFDEVKRSFQRLYAPVLDAAANVNPGLRGIGETNMRKIMEQIEFMQGKTKDAHDAKFETAQRHFERVKQSLVPLGNRQERVYNVFAYLNKYGAYWIDRLIEADLTEDGRHVAVFL